MRAAGLRAAYLRVTATADRARQAVRACALTVCAVLLQHAVVVDVGQFGGHRCLYA